MSQRSDGQGPKVLLIHAHGGHLSSEARAVVTIPARPAFVFQVRPGRAADQAELVNDVIPRRLWKQGYLVKPGETVPDYYLYKYRDKEPEEGASKKARQKAMTKEVQTLLAKRPISDVMGEKWRKELGDDFDVLVPKNRRAERVDKIGKSGHGIQTGVVHFSRVIEKLQACPNYALVFCSFCRVDFDDPGLKNL
jgi:hypothetical protein